MVVFWEGSNAANVMAGKSGSDTLEDVIWDAASVPFAFDGSSVWVSKIGTVVARSSMSGSADVGVGSLS